jgi:hypothetical protein
MTKIELFADPCTHAVRVGMGLTLRTQDGVRVLECHNPSGSPLNVTWSAYNMPAGLSDGRIGILRKRYQDGKYHYWLESEEQDCLERYTVEADRATGAWKGNPVWIGYASQKKWDRMRDTDEIQFRTFESDGRKCAIEVYLV